MEQKTKEGSPKKVGTCSICQGVIDVQVNPKTGEVFWEHGHNAEPVNSGRCCSKCNDTIVIPARIRKMVGDGK